MRKGSEDSAESSRHRELKRTIKIAVGTVQGPSIARKSTGLVQGQGQDKRELLRPSTPLLHVMFHKLGQ